jgi:DNA end-binding protein Ku
MHTFRGSPDIPTRGHTMPRAIATGQIAFGLVSIPVKLFSAAESSEKVAFNMLHDACGGRIQQQLFCPKDERTIDRTEVVKGYEFSKGQYVLFSEEELKTMEEKSTQQIDITEFVRSDLIDPIYFAKPYYLGPDKNGSRAYSLLARALQETGRWAVAKYAARGKGYLVVIRPLENGLVMQQLYYPNEIRSMDEIELGDTDVKENELRMAIQLAEMSASDEFHPENYRDEVKERIRSMIQMKIEGQEITDASGEEPKAQVIDLMEALRASLGGAATKPASKPSAKAEPAAKLRAVKAAPAKAAAKEERKAPRRSAHTVSVESVSSKKSR